MPTPLFNSAFKDSIESMEIDGIEQEEIINEKLFDDEDEHTVVYTMKDSVTSIGNVAFYYCTSLTSIDIPSGVTSISYSVFSNCSSLTSCTIGNGVTNIGGSAFQDCSSLTSIDIPNSVTSIGGYALYGCSSLTSITVEATTPPTLDNYAFNMTNNCPIYVPSASVDTYKSASVWSSYASRIQAIS